MEMLLFQFFTHLLFQSFILQINPTSIQFSYFSLQCRPANMINKIVKTKFLDNGCVYFHDLHSNVIVTLLGFFSGETFYIQM